MYLSLYSSIVFSNALDLEEFDVSVVPDGRVNVPQVDHSPHVGAEPHGRAAVGLVLANEDGVRNGQQTH